MSRRKVSAKDLPEGPANPADPAEPYLMRFFPSDDGVKKTRQRVHDLVTEFRANYTAGQDRTYTQDTHSGFLDMFTLMTVRLDGITRALEDLNQRRGFTYRGVFEPGEEYAPGDFVTAAGSLWACTSPTKEAPGAGAGWQLAVKRGRDAKDPAHD
jgi:hypothetical protein